MMEPIHTLTNFSSTTQPSMVLLYYKSKERSDWRAWQTTYRECWFATKRSLSNHSSRIPGLPFYFKRRPVSQQASLKISSLRTFHIQGLNELMSGLAKAMKFKQAIQVRPLHCSICVDQPENDPCLFNHPEPSLSTNQVWVTNNTNMEGKPNLEVFRLSYISTSEEFGGLYQFDFLSDCALCATDKYTDYTVAFKGITLQMQADLQDKNRALKQLLDSFEDEMPAFSIGEMIEKISPIKLDISSALLSRRRAMASKRNSQFWNLGSQSVIRLKQMEAEEFN